MPVIIPSLLRLIGEGFHDDEYAADGNHLRWMFHPALGFSRFPFCLERRPSVATKRGQADIEVRSEHLGDISEGQYQVIRGDVTVTRDDEFVGYGTVIPLAAQLPPVDIRFGGSPEPYAAWARVTIELTGHSRARVEAYHDSAGELRLVDTDSVSFRPIFPLRPRLPQLRATAARRVSNPINNLKALLKEPGTGRAAPRTRELPLREVYGVLVELDPNAYKHVNADYLRKVHGLITESGISIRELERYIPQTRTIYLDVFGDRIDFIRLSGHGAVVIGVTWALSESLMAANWEPVGCFSALTDEPDYVERNHDFLPADIDLEVGATDRMSSPMPHGAEPMDDPQVPPSRPPTLDERMRRYGVPWLERLETWMEKVLADSLDGSQHQSEITIQEALTEFGQKPGDGIPTLPAGVPSIGDQTQTITPYGMLLAASMAFPSAQLMGLAAIDRPPSSADIDRWDYRLTGIWRTIDLKAYGNKLQNELQRVQEAVTSASLAEKGSAITDLIQAFGEFWSGMLFLSSVLSGATSGLVKLTAYAGGLRTDKKPRFAAPETVNVSFEELAGLSGDILTGSRRVDRAVARVEWPMPARTNQIERQIAMLATIARRKQGSPQPFTDVLNPVDRDFGSAVGIVPLDSDPDDDGIATVDFFDRNVASGAPYRYGVTQSDLFGRWSSFTERDFQWTYDIPPPPPLGLQAELDEVGNPMALRLTVEFKWPVDLYPGADHEFSIYMSRDPLTPGGVHDPSVWATHGMERADGSGAGAFRFAGDFSGSANHDGMPVAVSFSDSTETDPAGIIKTYRNYRVRLRGVQLARVDELARCFAGVQSHDTSGIDSDEVAGPSRADHYDPNPPPPPVWPPDPLQASIADADGLSTFELTWTAAPQATYEVFRVGERDLVAHLQSKGVSLGAYDRDNPSNLRAAALKAVAVNPVSRKAFTRRSNLTAGAGTYIDQLPGYVSTLFLHVVLSRSPSNVTSPWPTTPDRFLAVEVPRAPLPATPVVLSARWQEAVGPGVQPLGFGDRVQLFIAEPAGETAPITAYEVYRTKSAGKAGDITTMRLLHRLDAPVFSGPADEVASATYIDPHIEPWTTYYYRVVARAPGTSSGVGMRSGPSTPVKLTTLGSGGPTAPTIDLTSRDIDGQVVVGFTAEAATTPAGDFVFDLITRGSGHVTRHTTARASVSRVSGDTHQMKFSDSEVPTGAKVHIRVTDPLGKKAESAGDPLPPL